VKMPIYRPLIGMDKDETVKIAREIGTFELFTKVARHACPFRPSSVVTRGSTYGLSKILEDFKSKSLWYE